MINGPLTETSAEQRWRGYALALEQVNLATCLKEGPFTREYGRKAMQELLSGDARPTAVIATNSDLAYGAIDIIREKKLSIPKDISFVCFDTPDYTGLIIPEFCTVNQPARRIGEVSTNVLFRKFKDNSEGLYERIYLDTEIVWGTSVARPLDA